MYLNLKYFKDECAVYIKFRKKNPFFYIEHDECIKITIIKIVYVVQFLYHCTF